MNKNYKALKSGTDIRGVAVATEGSPLQLTDEAVFDLACGFCRWLLETGVQPGSRIAVGHDSRVSAERIKAQVLLALTAFGFHAVDCGLASTPAMFMTTVDFDCAGAVQITASHHPFDRNGLKFFTTRGGVDSGDLDAIIARAETCAAPDGEKGSVETADYMRIYAKRLRKMICDELGVPEAQQPLKGYRIVVDAGNGVGGFYASDVLEPLGADTTGSQFLDPDGMFPNHAPNPENKAAMDAVSEATVNAGADLGIIFDTDVDRAACVDETGKEINRNRLVALASIIALEQNPGGTIVTDSVTSTGLTAFINETLGGVHYRYQRGYRNVINKQLDLLRAGVNCPLAIETSGHAAFKENYFLDDGAYLITKIIVKTAQMGRAGKKLTSLISSLKDPLEAKELRMKIKTDAFKAYGNDVIAAVERYAEETDGWRVADDNREGIRVFFDDAVRKGWFLLRLSVHDPIMPLNIESDAPGGAKKIAEALMTLLERFDLLDLAVVRDFIGESPCNNSKI